jgi:hypothetical protein
MNFRTLQRDSELIEFQTKVRSRVKVEFPLSFLQQCRVLGYFDEANQLVGGFAFAWGSNMRVLGSLPLSVQKHLDPTHLVEVTALWLCPSIDSRLDRAMFWSRLILEVFTLGDREIIFAYDARAQHLRRVYSLLQPRLVFEGQTLVLPGMDGPAVERVECAKALAVLMAPLRFPWAFLCQVLGLKRRRLAYASR